MNPRRATFWLYPCGVIALCVTQVVLGWKLAGEINTSPDEFDQGAYVLMAKSMRAAAYPWYSDGTRNPLIPWLAARFADPDSADFLTGAKRLNVILGALGTLVLAVFFRGRMPSLAAWNLTALGCLVVLLPSSTFFGAETLFFVLFLLLMAVGMRLLNANPLWLYAAFGLLAALTYLTKPSATPFLALWLGASVVRCALPKGRLPWFLGAGGWSRRRFALGLVIVAAIYGALAAPRFIHASKTWGNPFYSLPSFWFWADDWETCVTKYTDCRAERIRSMPPEERPTIQGYFLRNSTADALVRLTTGATVRLGQFFYPEKKWRVPFDRAGKPRRLVLPHRGVYVAALAGLLIVMGTFAARSGRLEELGPVAAPVLLFLATFAAYTLATGWYLPTGPGHRFILTLFLPTIWVLGQGASQLRDVARSRPAGAIYHSGHAAIAALLCLRLVSLLADPRFEKISYTF